VRGHARSQVGYSAVPAFLRILHRFGQQGQYGTGTNDRSRIRRITSAFMMVEKSPHFRAFGAFLLVLDLFISTYLYVVNNMAPPVLLKVAHELDWLKNYHAF
jgi:hypothetical protein